MPEPRRSAGPAPRVPLTVGITTRNRPQSLLRCLASLDLLDGPIVDVIVVDDSSDVPVADALRQLAPAMAERVRVIRQTASEGYIAGRNTIMRRAATEYVLLMDDDAHLLGPEGFEESLDIFEQHADVAAIGCAQADAGGSPWPAAMQPAPVAYRCRVASFIGFAHLLRRRAFLEVGGYDEALYFYGEEKGLCARFLTAGYQVLYLPDLLVAHVPDPAGRSMSRYLRYAVRNDCLFALSTRAWPAALVNLPVRLARYFPMSRANAPHDRGGFAWIVGDLLRALPEAVRRRAPMSRADLAAWRRLRRQPPAWRARPRTGPLGPVVRITVGITTRNRRASLAKALSSLTLIADLVASIIVVDDASDRPAGGGSGAEGLTPELAGALSIVRRPEPRGNIAGRNDIMLAAPTEYVLLCDDDACLLEARTVREGLEIMEGDPSVAAVGFAMAGADGAPWPKHMQASPSSSRCLIPSYIGFAHLIRRSAFLEVGGYHALYRFHGEEKDCCLRLMDAGYDIVYLPDPPIVHLHDPAGRDMRRYLRYVIRNDCLGAMFHQPILLALVMVPMRLARYVRMCRLGGVRDPGGLLWILGQLAAHAPLAARTRRPVKWSTLRRWRELRRSSPAYERPLGRAGNPAAAAAGAAS